MYFYLRHSLWVCSIVSLISAAVETAPMLAAPNSFACKSIDGTPTTVAMTDQGEVPIVKWNSSAFATAGYTPERRCQEVSGRFQKYYKESQLNYLTTGRMNGQPVICTTNEVGQGCNGLLFTLRANSSLTPAETLTQLMGVRIGASDALNESGRKLNRRQNVYLDMRKLMRTGVLEEARVSGVAAPMKQAPTRRSVW